MIRQGRLIAGIVIISSITAWASAIVPGTIRSYSTIYSIGVEWDVTGDANHNATCAVQYKKEGSPEWKQALSLFRVDYQGWYWCDPAQPPSAATCRNIAD